MLKKYHKIISAGLAIALIVVVQAFASPLPVFRYLIPAVVGFVVLVLYYSHRYLHAIHQWNIWKLVQIGLFFIAWFGVFVLLPSYMVRGVYLVASVPIIYFFLLLIGNFGEQLLINQTLLTGFGLLVASWGLQFYYRLAESYVFVLEFFAMFLLIRASLELIPHSRRLKTLSALVISLFVSQIHWALSFWPLHYSALALICFSMFYAMWILYHFALFNVLTTRRVQFYLAFALFSIIIIVLASPWRILG